MSFQIERVLISDEIDQQCVDYLKENGVDVVKNTKLTKEQLLEEIKNFDALIVRSATKVTADVINSGERLKVVGRAGTGVDNIDCEAATKRGVLVMNTPAGNTISAAEHTCALICSLSRHVAQASASMVAGRWDRKKYMGSELFGKTLAILGLGRIGREVAVRMQSFGMRTIGFDPIIPAEETAKFKVESLTLDEIWPQADYISVHTPLIPQTKNLINAGVLAKCKPSVRLVNVARGGIIDEAALLEALKAGRCGGAGLDVFVEEPPSSYELAQHPLVIATPHLGASTSEAQVRVAMEVAEQIVALSSGQALLGAINGAALAPALDPSSAPWLALASGLALAVQWRHHSATQPLRATLVCAEGAPERKLQRLLEAQLSLAGLSQPGLNLVSGPPAAKAAGVRVELSWRAGAEAALELQVAAASASGAVRGGRAALDSVGGATLRQSVTLADCVSIVPRSLQETMAAVGAKGISLHSLTASCDGATSVLVADQAVDLPGAVSFSV